MKATGIVRRIDDLGRVVIPKEIRRTMRIREGDPLEIYTTRDGEVISKKYSLIGGLEDFAAQFCDTLSRNTDFTAAVTDRDGIVAVAGAGKRELLGKNLSPAGADRRRLASLSMPLRAGAAAGLREHRAVRSGGGRPHPVRRRRVGAGTLCLSGGSSPRRGGVQAGSSRGGFSGQAHGTGLKGSREAMLSGSLPCLSQQLEGSMDQHTDRHPHRRRQHHGQQRPPVAAGDAPADEGEWCRRSHS